MLLLAVATSISLGRPAINVIPAVPFYVAGYVILHRVGSHPIGWLLCGIGVALQVTAFESLPWLSYFWITWLESWGFSAMFALFAWLFILFPDGRASKRWRTVGWVATVLVLGGVLTPTITVTGDSSVALGMNPTGLQWLPEATSIVCTMAITALLVLSAVGVVVRGRRADQELRPRYKPVLATIAVLGVFILMLLATLVVDPTFTDNDRYGSVVWSVAIVLYMLVPMSFGVAITRYRLYEIDRVVSRTVTYALVAVVVSAIYIVPVVTLPGLVGESNDLVVAASTLAAAAAFDPARRRIQRRVDHRFNRARYDAEREIETLATRLGTGAGLGVIDREIRTVLESTVAPESSLLWIASPATKDGGST
jgi:hypothetical protein